MQFPTVKDARSAIPTIMSTSIPRRTKRAERRLQNASTLLAAASTPARHAAVLAQLERDAARIAQRASMSEDVREARIKRKAEKRSQGAVFAADMQLRRERPPPRRIYSVEAAHMDALSGIVDDFCVRLCLNDPKDTAAQITASNADRTVLLNNPVLITLADSASSFLAESMCPRTYRCADGRSLAIKKQSPIADLWVYSLADAGIPAEFGRDGVQDFHSRGDVATALLHALATRGRSGQTATTLYDTEPCILASIADACADICMDPC